jgi:D-methionine transport system ATP-binding protein
MPTLASAQSIVYGFVSDFHNRASIRKPSLRAAKCPVRMIQLESIVQTYTTPSGPVDALRGVSLQVGRGEIAGIIGRSGAGKSSLVRTINLLNRPQQGRVLVDGQDLTTLDAYALRLARRNIGMVFQHFNLLSGRTVFDNVALPLELQGMRRAQILQRVAPLLDLVGLSGLRNRYPAQISGGQKQRVGIARALASKPRVLLSDEATSSLDPETTRSILELLHQIRSELDLTIVLITHEMQVIRQVADTVAVLEAGQIVERGPTLQVFSQPASTVTRSLLGDVIPQHLPASVLERARTLLANSAGTSSRLLRLVFAGACAHQPLLSDAIRRYALDINVLHGQVDEIQGQTLGTLAILAHGSADGLTQSMAFLRSAGVLVEEVPHA